jgi:hypothetical protein
MLAAKWAALAGEVDYMRERLDLNLLMEGVRHSHDVPGDKLGDSPEASMVRVHARAALGALNHLSDSLETVATKLDAQAS